MPDLTVMLYHRDFTQAFPDDGLSYTVLGYDKTAQFGAREATIQVRGSWEALAGLQDRLRCKVEIVDGKGVVDTMIGMGLFNVQSIHLLESMIGFYIPRDIRSKLTSDRDNSPPQTPLQKRMGEIFKPLLEGEK